MAEIVGSAVANKSVSKIFSILSAGDHGENPQDRTERLELAVLKIHGVVSVSGDWQIAAHQPLLNWKARLRSAAEEGDGILRASRWRRRRRSSAAAGTARLAGASSVVYRRIGRAARRFMPFAFGRGAGAGDEEEEEEDGPSEATVRRFEKLAGSADEFFRYVRVGGRRRPRSLVVSIRVPTGLLRAGKTLEISIRNGSQDALLVLHPWRGGEGALAGRRVDEVALGLSYDDGDATRWQKNIKLAVVFRLPDDHIYILDIVMSSLELLPPQFTAACVTVREFIGQVLTQGTSFSSRPSAMSVWCGGTVCKCHHFSSEIEKGCGNDGGGGGRLQLSPPIVRVLSVCYAPPPQPTADAGSGLPVKVRCHISPRHVPGRFLRCHIYPRHVPGRFYDQYDQIEPQELMQELLPARGAAQGTWWCPLRSTYLSMEPELLVPPPTLQQLYLMDNPEKTA